MLVLSKIVLLCRSIYMYGSLRNGKVTTSSFTWWLKKKTVWLEVKHKHYCTKSMAVVIHTNLHNPVLQQLHWDVSYEHSHLFSPGHSFTSTVIVSSMNTVQTKSKHWPSLLTLESKQSCQIWQRPFLHEDFTCKMTICSYKIPLLLKP